MGIFLVLTLIVFSIVISDLFLYFILRIEFYLNFKKNTYISCYFHEQHIDFMIDIEAPKISFCKYFKLNKLSGVYLNSDRKEKMIQRLSGISFLNKKQSCLYFKKLKLKK